ncbi:MAG: hypothetical protein P8X96_05560 [Desulfobacteraceae bacterium]|jgi:hypothetical protein
MWQKFVGLAVIFLTLIAGSQVSAQTKWQAYQTLHLENEPLDMQVDNQTRRIYVLNDAGEILVYGFNGQMKGKIEVGTDVVRIKPGPGDGTLFLLRKKDKSIQSISIHVKEEIDISGSPFKGEKDAPVTIAVFSDFQ